MKIAIVADDLTGALDAAVPFADLGRDTRVGLDIEAASAMASSDVPVVSVDACTRHLPPSQAAGLVRLAMQRLLALDQRLDQRPDRRLDRRIPFKKIDSTLRGNVGAETLAALAGSGRRCAILSPAAPRLGRRLHRGRLIVNGEPVAGGDLVQALRVQLPDVPVQLLTPGEEVRSTGDPIRLFVADAQEETDLDRLVDLALARPDEILLVGSSGLAGALARRGGLAGGGAGEGSCAAADVPSRFRRILFVVGSRNTRSIGQLQALLGMDGVTDLSSSFDDNAGQPPSCGGGHMSRVGVIHAASLEDASVPDSVRVAQRLAEVVGSVLSDDLVDDTAIVMTGGDTARSVLDHLGIQGLEVSRSLAPGVVLSKADLGGRRLCLVTKAGGFGETDLFVRLAGELLAEH